MKPKNKEHLFSAYWLIISLLGVLMLIRGIWAMTQPWGNIYQKLFAWLFFLVLLLFSLYKFKASRSSSGSPWNSEIMQNLMYGIGSTTFTLGGILILLLGTPEKRCVAVAGILFFGFGAVYYFRKFIKLKNG